MQLHDKPSTCLGIFAKYWQPGQVKTRLAAGVGPERAAAIYCQFVHTLLARLDQHAEVRLLVFSPKQHASDFETILSHRWRQLPQANGDLGQRMKDFFARRFAEGFQRVIILGTDSPNLPLEIVDSALAKLKTDPVVLGPTEDGGYYLVGAQGPHVPPIFTGIPWSTPQVWEATLKALSSSNTSFHTLRYWYDVDNVTDFQRLLLELDDSDEPRLQQLLRDLKAI